MKKLLSFLLAVFVLILSVVAVSAQSSTVFGDVDNDGKIAVADATMMQRHIARVITLSENQLTAADVDGDKKLQITDVTLVQQKIAHIIESFPVEKPAPTPDNKELYCPTDTIDGDILTADMLWEIEKEFYRLVNEERESVGLAPLNYDKHLDDIAQIRSLETTELFSHTRPNGEAFQTIIDRDLYSWITVGENICYFHHISGSFDPEDVVFTGSQEQLYNAALIVFNAFKNSPGHYANMTSAKFVDAGIGISYKWNSELDIPVFYLSHNFGASF